MRRRRPSSTLFPYTTLFRSDVEVTISVREEDEDRVAVTVADTGPGIPDDLKPRIDRKSTRLNSSHVRISYAVFCLKKKSQQQHPPDPSGPGLPPGLSIYPPA